MRLSRESYYICKSRSTVLCMGIISETVLRHAISATQLLSIASGYVMHISPQYFSHGVNTLRPRQNWRYFADDIFKCIFLNENAWISLKISLKFVSKVRIDNIPALVQIMAWRRPGDKPLSEPMMVSLLTHICVTRPQWVNHIALYLKQFTIIEMTSKK